MKKNATNNKVINNPPINLLLNNLTEINVIIVHKKTLQINQ